MLDCPQASSVLGDEVELLWLGGEEVGVEEEADLALAASWARYEEY